MFRRYACLVVFAAACSDVAVDPDGGSNVDGSRSDASTDSGTRADASHDSGSSLDGDVDPSGECTDANDCLVGGTQGTCRQSTSDGRYCSFPDGACPAPSAHRWGDDAISHLAGRCVDSPPSQGPLSDDFNGTSVSPSWTVFKPSLVDIAVSGGELHLTASEYSVWYQGDTGPALFKNVTGNFRMTSIVRVRSVSQPSEPPPPVYQFGGLLARDPGSAQENWLFAVIGERSGYIALESKTTVNGQSTINAPEWPSEIAEIRICRYGAAFLLLAREVGQTTWMTQGNHTRNDLPQTLQVGPIVYAYTNTPDIRASFDRVEIETVASLAQCTSD